MNAEFIIALFYRAGKTTFPNSENSLIMRSCRLTFLNKRAQYAKRMPAPAESDRQGHSLKIEKIHYRRLQNATISSVFEILTLSYAENDCGFRS
jgi:hypothetical protein